MKRYQRLLAIGASASLAVGCSPEKDTNATLSTPAVGLEQCAPSSKDKWRTLSEFSIQTGMAIGGAQLDDSLGSSQSETKYVLPAVCSPMEPSTIDAGGFLLGLGGFPDAKCIPIGILTGDDQPPVYGKKYTEFIVVCALGRNSSLSATEV